MVDFMSKEAIIKEYHNYMKDYNNEASKKDFINDFIAWAYDIGKITIKDFPETYKYLKKVLKKVK